MHRTQQVNKNLSNSPNFESKVRINFLKSWDKGVIFMKFFVLFQKVEQIFPGVKAEGIDLTIPMPGYTF